MTEGPWSELGTALHAHRLEMVRLAGRAAQRSAEMAAEVKADAPTLPGTIARWAEESAQDAIDLAAGIESIVRRTDALLDDTAIMSLDEVADEPLSYCDRERLHREGVRCDRCGVVPDRDGSTR